MTAAVDTKWFRDRLADRGLSANRLAAEMGLHKTAMSRLLNGARGWDPQEAAEIARLLGVPLTDVLRKAGIDIPAHEGKKTVPIVGSVGPSGLVKMGGVAAPRVAERPPGSHEDTIALRVAAPGSWADAWVCYVVPSTRIEPDAVGRLSLVTVLGGDKMLRVLHRGKERGRWALRGWFDDAASHDLAIESAAPVLWVRA
jgi:transcriptional regulator with XRE-family HTH domain